MRRLLCVNDSGETIPPGGCFRIRGVSTDSKSGELRFSAVKPDGGDRFYYFNGPVAVPDGQTLYADLVPDIVRARVSDSVAAEVGFGGTLGPSDDAWDLSADGSLFALHGEKGDDGLYPVKVLTGGSGGGGVFGRGVIVAVDCAAGTVDVDLHFLSFCGTPPDESYGVVVAKDPYNFLTYLTEDELLSAGWVRIEYMYDIRDPYSCPSQWELTLVSYGDHCNDPLSYGGI